MSRQLLIALAPLALATPAAAQHEHHAPPATPPAADPHAGHAMPAAPAADPHAGHSMPPPAADPHAGHVMPAPANVPPAGNEPAPPVPGDYAAERYFDRQAMAAARAQLAKEHGGGKAWKVMLSTAEVRPGSDEDAYAWEGEFWYGGDINRLVLKSAGEGEFGGDLHSAEAQVLYSRAIGPYFDLQAGVRHDFEPGPSRTYATVGFEGVAPYWFELEGAAFLSEKGDLSARLEGAYDLRLTQKLILEPRAEVELAAQEVPELGIGSGLTSAELGLRLRYEFRREFGPYVGVSHERKFGDTADLARAAGEDVEDTRFVLGVRAWF
ncbi:MAG: copper resistance protein CopB [Phenylobacterium sp.]|uniref:copper resistance protein B n=1 Tax=Phenylobacterium sp. TaxID=1871053 RepID=UPI0025CFF99C|nr:copper resistance protein B [Phenylobacterium sp.]MBA4011837.1 copper resistance protein CopB [Phenylobacterium sp.]